jgi:HEAT repeat protein
VGLGFCLLAATSALAAASACPAADLECWFSRIAPAEPAAQSDAWQAMLAQKSATIDFCVRKLADESQAVRNKSAALLMRFGLAAETSLIPVLLSGNNHQKSRAAYILGQIQSTAAVPNLLTLLRAKDTGLRSNAVFALGRIGDARAIPAIVERTNDSDPYVRSSAIFALIKMKESSAAYLRQEMSQGGDARKKMLRSILSKVEAAPATSAGPKQKAAVGAASKTTSPPKSIAPSNRPAPLPADPSKLAEYYQVIISSKNEAEVKAASKGLARIGTPAIPDLLRLLGDQDEIRGKRAATTLARMGKMAYDPLMSSLSHQNTYIRARAALALGLMKSKEALPALRQRLSDPAPEVRAFTAYALGLIGDASPVPALIQALADKEANVRLEACKALGKIADSSALEALVLRLQDHNLEVAAAATKAIVNVPGVTRLEMIKQQMNGDNVASLAYGAYLLGVLGTTADIPFLEALAQDNRSFQGHAIADYARESIQKLSVR